jgi:hypothetical protein
MEGVLYGVEGEKKLGGGIMQARYLTVLAR